MGREPTRNIRRILSAREVYSPESYMRAATQRLDAAKFLLNNSKCYLDAVYLAGYVIECSLKAVILRRTPSSKRTARCEEIGRGAQAHNIDFLERILRQAEVSILDEILECLRAIKPAWITKLRYNGVLIPFVEANYFINHVDRVYRWAERGK